jgi:hypothetical protein
LIQKAQILAANSKCPEQYKHHEAVVWFRDAKLYSVTDNSNSNNEQETQVPAALADSENKGKGEILTHAIATDGSKKTPKISSCLIQRTRGKAPGETIRKLEPAAIALCAQPRTPDDPILLLRFHRRPASSDPVASREQVNTKLFSIDFHSCIVQVCAGSGRGRAAILMFFVG